MSRGGPDKALILTSDGGALSSQALPGWPASQEQGFVSVWSELLQVNYDRNMVCKFHLKVDQFIKTRGCCLIALVKREHAFNF